MTWCWHRWSKWEPVTRGGLVDDERGSEPVVVGNYEVQRRECEKCGKSQLRMAET